MQNTIPDVSQTSVLLQMGFKVISIQYGVYHLQQFEGENGALSFDGVGMFVSPHPVSSDKPVMFFEFNGIAFSSDEKAFSNLIRNWAELDARRLEQSGVYGVPIPRHQDHFGHVAKDLQALARPCGDRFRMYALMESGDVICYN